MERGSDQYRRQDPRAGDGKLFCFKRSTAPVQGAELTWLLNGMLGIFGTLLCGSTAARQYLHRRVGVSQFEGNLGAQFRLRGTEPP